MKKAPEYRHQQDTKRAEGKEPAEYRREQDRKRRNTAESRTRERIKVKK